MVIALRERCDELLYHAEKDEWRLGYHYKGTEAAKASFDEAKERFADALERATREMS